MSDTRPRSRANKPLTSIARHGQLKKANPFAAAMKLVAAALAVLLVSSLSVGAIALAQIEGNIEGVKLVGEGEGPPPELGTIEGGFNVLIVGSDECEYSDGCQGRGSTRLNDVTMLVHVSEDQTNVTAVSFPRDLIVPIPSCPTEDGTGVHSAMTAQPINSTLSYGGLACTVLTVEELTGLDIQYAGLITFKGVVQMSTAVGGVDVCVNGPVVDRKANGINLPKAGTYNIEGWEALGFLRTRYGVGDGSDVGRNSNQRVYLSALVRKIIDDGVLSDPATLFRLATTATKSMQLSTHLKNVTTMVSMAGVLKDIDLSKVQFVQYPGLTSQGGIYANKVMPLQEKADELFELIRNDEPFSLEVGKTGRGAVLDPSKAPPPAEESTEPPADAAAPEVPVLEGVEGQSAADHTCSKSN